MSLDTLTYVPLSVYHKLVNGSFSFWNTADLSNQLTEHNMATALLVGLLAALLVYYVFGRRGEADKYPPGPWKLPIIGNLHQILLAGSLVNFCEAKRNRYGNVFTITLGGYKRIVVSGYDNFCNLLIKNGDISSTRSPATMNSEVAFPGLLWAPFPQWKKLRSLAISSFREDGMGKASLEPQIMLEVDSFMEQFITPRLGMPIGLDHSLQLATSNIISQMVFAKRHDYSDQKANAVVKAISDMFTLFSKMGLFSNIPFTGLIKRYLHKQMRQITLNTIRPFCTAYANEHHATYNEDYPRDVMDRYISQANKAEDEADHRCFSDKNAISFCGQLYTTGTETTSTALNWALLYMCLYPEMQRRVQAEIDEQIGGEREASCKDRMSMPFTDAVLLETLRKCNIVPTSIPHTIAKDIELEGKLIPAGSDVLMNMQSVLHDKAVFDQPEKFRPERYLTGDVALKRQRTVPFGVGRRSCLGESLAKMEMFLFFITFLQRFNVRFPDNYQVSQQPLTRFVNSPQPYKLIFTPRRK